eukprot:14323398-Alexandrium_andersonii.AAC.1
MSASLVGSEMCIRDSAPSLGGLPPPRPPPRKEPPATCTEAIFGGSPGPVSYTHLTLPTICSV